MPKKIIEIHERGHASFKGVFLLRGKTIPLIDLCDWFNYQLDSSDEVRKHRTVIVTEMSGKRFGFITHGVDKVHRITWKKIIIPPEMIAKCRALLGQLPVLLFSSMINDVQRKMGQDVGATDQITKPEIAQLVQRLQTCLVSAES